MVLGFAEGAALNAKYRKHGRRPRMDAGFAEKKQAGSHG
jgi:hypothetical protein